MNGWHDHSMLTRGQLADHESALHSPTAGDLAKAMHDAHAVLGYWPDPDKIGGQWEVWGEALRAALPTPKENAS